AMSQNSFPRKLDVEREMGVVLDRYIGTIRPFVMQSGPHTEDALVLESATVGVVADSTSGVHEGRLSAFLTDWGYQPKVIDWTEPSATVGLDMVLVNHPSYGEDGLLAFLDQVNRNDLPVVWAGNRDRGVIEDMVSLYGNP